ncbi:hypothetical protein GGR56DRAFT_476715 [Xylariaceae sp. FL0804]|nr:hypothetical protein GGR56DRAFT_476715 [Xylariaceae sp. FL0804]
MCRQQRSKRRGTRQPSGKPTTAGNGGPQSNTRGEDGQGSTQAPSRPRHPLNLAAIQLAAGSEFHGAGRGWADGAWSEQARPSDVGACSIANATVISFHCAFYFLILRHASLPLPMAPRSQGCVIWLYSVHAPVGYAEATCLRPRGAAKVVSPRAERQVLCSYRRRSRSANSTKRRDSLRAAGSPVMRPSIPHS